MTLPPPDHKNPNYPSHEEPEGWYDLRSHPGRAGQPYCPACGIRAMHILHRKMSKPPSHITPSNPDDGPFEVDLYLCPRCFYWFNHATLMIRK